MRAASAGGVPYRPPRKAGGGRSALLQVKVVQTALFFVENTQFTGEKKKIPRMSVEDNTLLAQIFWW